jgi:hypothetical protein
MKLKKINKILKDPTTSKRLKKEIHFLFEQLESISMELYLTKNKPIQSTEELFNQPKAGEITLKAIRTIPGIITEGKLYQATSNENYYIFEGDNGLRTNALIKEHIKTFEVIENK